MKKGYLLIVLILLNLVSFAKDITVQQALKVATTYYSNVTNSNLKSSDASIVREKAYIDVQGNKHVSVYVVNMNQNKGFVLVSGSDKTVPVLGYVDAGAYDEAKIPAGLKKLMFNYAKEIKRINQDQTIQASSTIKMQWTALKNGTMMAEKAGSVSPLITTEWSQSSSSGNYNGMCPGGTPSGCVATATAQIMKYHNHPPQGSGSHSYNHNDYGTLSANFGATQYDWTNMPNSLNSSSTQVQKDAINQLMFHIGVSLDMNYSPGNSGAFSRDVPDVLVDNFFYSSTAQFIKRSHYSLSSWKTKIEDELDANRVVYHSGFCPSPQAGHAFVVDGYNATGQFHLNWGWGGYANGYFEINNLNPGSTYTFNATQSAIIKIEPVTLNTDVRMFGNMVLSTPNMMYNDPFSVAIDVANYGNIPYTGNFRAALYDLNDAFVGEVDVVSNITIAANDYASLTFSTTGLSVPPGDYNLGIYYEDENGAWSLAMEDGYNNPIPVSINGTNPQGLISNGNILVNPDPIQQNDPVQVEFDILNNNATAFNGEISIDLHELNGDWITEVNHASYTLAANATQNIVFSNTGFSNAPGSYKLVIWHKPSGGSWEIIEDGIYPNSKAVDIVGLNYSNIPDSYENNNTEALAYQVPMNFVQDEMTFTSSGANVHSVTADSNDYYSFLLEAGYDYKIYSRVHDNYNSQIGTFSNDVIFKVNASGYWSDFYDDIEMDTITITGVNVDEDYLVDVVPFFYNELGTYDMEVFIKRTPSPLSIESEVASQISLYPNPVNNLLNVELGSLTVSTIQILDLQGRVVYASNEMRNNKLQVATDVFQSGLYLIQLHTDKGLVTRRFEVLK